MSEKPNNGRVHDPSLREIVSEIDGFKELMSERDRRYEERFAAEKELREAASNANKESTAAAFASSEKAIQKAEDAQKQYNQTHNDLSRKMEEQAKQQMPRNEIESRINSIEKQIGVIQTTQDIRRGKAEGISTTWAVIFAVLTLGLGFSVAIIGWVLQK